MFAKQTITFADGSKRELAFTLGTFRRLHIATGVDFFEDMGKLTPRYFPDLIAAALTGEPSLTADQVADLIPLAELAAVSDALVAGLGGTKADPNATGTA